MQRPESLIESKPRQQPACGRLRSTLHSNWKASGVCARPGQVRAVLTAVQMKLAAGSLLRKIPGCYDCLPGRRDAEQKRVHVRC